MRIARSLVSVVERIHAPVPDTQSWLEGVRSAAAAAFDGHLGVQAYTLSVGTSSASVDQIATERPALERIMRENYRYADEKILAVMRARTVIRASTAVPQHPSRDFAEQHGIADVLAAVGFADARRACVASFFIALDQPTIDRRVRTAFGRLAAHLAAAYRLRASDGTEGDAVLTPEGTLVHATGDAAPARERLCAAARAILDAKRAGARDPGAGLDFWRAMVDGRWTLVERVDTDGRRLLIARKNAPSTRPNRALTERERGVLERASLGRPLAYIAYELGLAGSTVSETLARALGKLGIANRAELVEMRAALVGPARA
jgi:DNA-binding CsgD family transcriptional regulator